MTKKPNLMKDCMNMLKSTMSSDLNDKSADDLMGMLGKLKGYVNELNEEMNKNPNEEAKAKYKGGIDALDNMITKGMEDPTADIDTEGLDEYIDIAKKSKQIKDIDK